MTAWMTEAWTHSGVTETTGPEATPAIKAFFAQVGRPDVVSDEVPWCAAFVNACLDRAGISLNAVPKGERLLARSCLKIGVEIKEPQVGCIAVFKRGADPHAGHVGFVTGWTATHILLLGGNQANAVNVRAYPRSDLLGLRWPEVKTAADLASEGSRIVTTAARQTSTATKIAAVTAAGASIPTPDASVMATLDAVASGAAKAQGYVKTLEAFAVFAWAKWPWIAATGALYWALKVGWDAGWIKAFRVEDANSGATTKGRSGDAVASA